jgi:hypothetical protein
VNLIWWFYKIYKSFFFFIIADGGMGVSS